MRKLAISLLILMLLGFWLSYPATNSYSTAELAGGDASRGELMLHAGGCVSCHGADLGGGEDHAFSSGMLQGVFRAPNITPDRDHGIGDWTTLQFVQAMKDGVSPDGRHYYPAFPYTSYTRMTVADLVDLKAYLDRLEPVVRPNREHELPFPWNIRLGIGVWKRLYFDRDPVLAPAEDETWKRGQYLAEGPSHCGECHSPRNALGGLQLDLWLSGAPDPSGKGRVPDITQSPDGLAEWSESDIRYYLESGFTPDFDTAGGSMVKVQENIAQLPPEDIAAIARYIKTLPGASQ